MLIEIWERATTTSPPLPTAASLAVAVLALALTWSPGGYRLGRHLVTFVHEAGHALAGIAAGRQLTGIRLHADTSGLTVSRGRRRGAGMVVTLAAGYPAPALAGVGAAAALGAGYAAGLLWALVAACALTVPMLRNLYGLWAVVAMGAGVAALSWLAPPDVLTATAYLLTWFLLLAAPRAVVDLHRQRRRRGAPASDADQLACLSGLPASMWVGLFWLTCVAALLTGGWLLLPGLVR